MTVKGIWIFDDITAMKTELKSQGLFAQKPGPTLGLGSEWDPRVPVLACFCQCLSLVMPVALPTTLPRTPGEPHRTRAEASSSSLCRETGSSRPPGSSGSMDDKWTQARQWVASHENQPGPFTSCWRVKEKANKCRRREATEPFPWVRKRLPSVLRWVCDYCPCCGSQLQWANWVSKQTN